MKGIIFNKPYLEQLVFSKVKTMTKRPITLPSDFDTLYNNDYTKLIPPYKIGEIVAIKQAYKDLSYEHYYYNNIDFRKLEKTPGFKNKMCVNPNYMAHFIKITNIFPQRLQDITVDDCMKQGISAYKELDLYLYNAPGSSLEDMNDTAQESYKELVDNVYKKGIWEKNEWFWTIEFKLMY